MGLPLASSQIRFASSMLQRSDAPDLRRFCDAQGNGSRTKKDCWSPSFAVFASHTASDTVTTSPSPTLSALRTQALTGNKYPLTFLLGKTEVRHWVAPIVART